MCVWERERDHYVHSASLAYERGPAFMSEPFAEWLVMIVMLITFITDDALIVAVRQCLTAI